MRQTQHRKSMLLLVWALRYKKWNWVVCGFDNYETITWKSTRHGKYAKKTSQTFLCFIFPGSVLKFVEEVSLELHSCDIVSLGKAVPPCAFRRTQKQWSASVSTCKMKLSTEMPHCNKKISCTSYIYKYNREIYIINVYLFSIHARHEL